MKSYDEMAQSVLERAQVQIKRNKKMRTTIFSVVAGSLAILMICVFVGGGDTSVLPSVGGETVTQYKLPSTGGDNNSWFYEKYNTKVNTIDSVWFETVDGDTVSTWCGKYNQEKKMGTLDTTYPMLIKFIMDCNISEETCRDVMSKIRKNEEKFGVEQTICLTADEIQVVFSGDSKQINETFVSEYCIVVNGNIFTPEWLLNHPVSEYRREGITYSQYKEKLESQYVGMLQENDEFLQLYEDKLDALNKK